MYRFVLIFAAMFGLLAFPSCNLSSKSGVDQSKLAIRDKAWWIQNTRNVCCAYEGFDPNDSNDDHLAEGELANDQIARTLCNKARTTLQSSFEGLKTDLVFQGFHACDQNPDYGTTFRIVFHDYESKPDSEKSGGSAPFNEFSFVDPPVPGQGDDPEFRGYVADVYFSSKATNAADFLHMEGSGVKAQILRGALHHLGFLPEEASTGAPEKVPAEWATFCPPAERNFDEVFKKKLDADLQSVGKAGADGKVKGKPEYIKLPQCDANPDSVMWRCIEGYASGRSPESVSLTPCEKKAIEVILHPRENELTGMTEEQRYSLIDSFDPNQPAETSATDPASSVSPSGEVPSPVDRPATARAAAPESTTPPVPPNVADESTELVYARDFQGRSEGEYDKFCNKSALLACIEGEGEDCFGDSVCRTEMDVAAGHTHKCATAPIQACLNDPDVADKSGCLLDRAYDPFCLMLCDWESLYDQAKTRLSTYLEQQETTIADLGPLTEEMRNSWRVSEDASGAQAFCANSLSEGKEPTAICDVAAVNNCVRYAGGGACALKHSDKARLRNRWTCLRLDAEEIPGTTQQSGAQQSGTQEE